jgi:hypothetical protein
MTVTTMSQLDLTGKRVLIREDLNVPVKHGKITSDARLVAALPTLRLALEKGAAVMVCSHLGRPVEGEFLPDNSLKPVADYLTQALGRPVPLLAHYLDGVTIQPGEIVLLENVRFNKGEKKNNDELAQKIRRSMRCFRDGCLRHRAPRRSLHPRRSQICKYCLRRSAAGRRTGCTGQGPRQPGRADDRHRCRLQGVHQAGCAEVAGRAYATN